MVMKSVLSVNRINTNTDTIYLTHSASVIDICPQTVILAVGTGRRGACQCVCEGGRVIERETDRHIGVEKKGGGEHCASVQER